MSDAGGLFAPPWSGAAGLFRPRSAAGPHLPGALRRAISAFRLAPVYRARRAARTGAAGGGVAALLGRAAAAFETETGASPSAAALGAALDMLDGFAVDLAAPDERRDALAIAASAIALRRGRAHVCFFNESLAAAAHARASPVLDRLSVGHALIGAADDLGARREAYKAAIVYVSARRLAQDALLDADALGGALDAGRARIRRLARSDESAAPVLGAGAAAALLDDVDLLLLSSGATAALGSEGEIAAGRRLAEEAFAIISALSRPSHYDIDPATRRIRLTETGEARAASFALAFGGPWTARSWRDETLLSALAIRDLYEAGISYQLEEGRVVLPGAGGAPPGVSPSIPELIAAKEGMDSAAPGGRQISLLRLFTRYLHLGGAGVELGALKRELRDRAGLRVRRRGAPPPPMVVEAYADAAGKVARLARFVAEGWALWAPTEADRAALAHVRDAEVLTGADVFSPEADGRRILQTAAASPQIEARFRARSGEGAAVVCLDDAYFEPLDEALADRVREGVAAMTTDVYRKLQSAREAYAAEQRGRHARADEYFDAVMAFAGDPT